MLAERIAGGDERTALNLVRAVQRSLFFGVLFSQDVFQLCSRRRRRTHSREYAWCATK